jgi:hypothetical protein
MSAFGCRTLSDVRLESSMRTKADVRQRYGIMSSRPSIIMLYLRRDGPPHSPMTRPIEN